MGGSAPSVLGRAAPRLASAIAASPDPFVMMLDDLHDALAGLPRRPGRGGRGYPSRIHWSPRAAPAAVFPPASAAPATRWRSGPPISPSTPRAHNKSSCRRRSSSALEAATELTNEPKAGPSGSSRGADCAKEQPAGGAGRHRRRPIRRRLPYRESLQQPEDVRQFPPSYRSAQQLTSPVVDAVARGRRRTPASSVPRRSVRLSSWSRWTVGASGTASTRFPRVPAQRAAAHRARGHREAALLVAGPTGTRPTVPPLASSICCTAGERQRCVQAHHGADSSPFGAGDFHRAALARRLDDVDVGQSAARRRLRGARVRAPDGRTTEHACDHLDTGRRPRPSTQCLDGTASFEPDKQARGQYTSPTGQGLERTTGFEPATLTLAR